MDCRHAFRRLSLFCSFPLTLLEIVFHNYKMVICLTAKSQHGDDGIGDPSHYRPIDRFDDLRCPFIAHVARAINRTQDDDGKTPYRKSEYNANSSSLRCSPR